MDTPTYRILWPAATIALPVLQDFQVSVPIHIPAKFMRSSQLDLNNFNRWPPPLIDRHTRLGLLELLLYLGFKDSQVSVSWLFTAVANMLHGTE